jgi:hypothetical protein
MIRVLKPDGMLTIVTDNLWYGKLLIRLVSAMDIDIDTDIDMDPSSSLSSCSAGDRADDDHIISSHYLQCASVDRQDRKSSSSGVMQKKGSDTAASAKDSDWRVQDSAGGVHLFVGRPGADAGHVVDASSYFDR